MFYLLLCDNFLSRLPLSYILEARLPQISQKIYGFLLSIFLLWVVLAVFFIESKFIQLVVEEGGRYFLLGFLSGEGTS